MFTSNEHSLVTMNEHFNGSYTKNELFFVDVAQRLKSALCLPNDVALAEVLGLSKSNYANKKASGAVPYEAVVNLCRAKGLNLEWVLFGIDRVFMNSEHSEVLEIVPILGTILTELDKAFQDAAAKSPGKWTDRKPSLHDLGTFGALVYERLKRSRFQDAKALVSAVRGQAADVASAYWLNEVLKYVDNLADRTDLNKPQSPE